MFLSLVRPDRISSLITRIAAVMTSELAARASVIGPLPRISRSSAVARTRFALKPRRQPGRRFHELFRGRCRPRTGIAITAVRRRGSMTYCCGILVRDGMVMIADTRTNAGLDNISTSRKLHVFRQPGERVLVLTASGNLSISQSVVSMLNEGIENPEGGESATLMNAPTMFQAAQRIGDAVLRVHHIEGPALEASDVKFDVSFLFGGQIKGDKLRLYMIYSAGNFIECT